MPEPRMTSAQALNRLRETRVDDEPSEELRSALAETDNRPCATFFCLHCERWQLRLWPHPRGPNYCNDCGRDMGPIPVYKFEEDQP